MSDFESIARQAKSLAAENTTTDFAAVALNFVALPLTMGLFCIDVDDKTKTKKVAVPDEWLVAVSGLPVISRKGLELLADAMKEKGWVSLAEAVRFIEIEQDAIKLATKKDGDVNKAAASSAGASLLLARAEKELPGTIKRFAEGAQSFAEATGGVLSFTVEKAVWIGKGLGVVASFMRDIRKS
jgi:hypothetical protein